MAAAAAATVDNESERACGGCLEIVCYLNNPGKLPCGDIYCITCRDDHFTTDSKKEVECLVCRQKVVNHFVLLDQDDKGVELCDELKCYHCGNNPTHYCKDCDIHLCDTDLEGHNKYQRENHDVITTGVFRENPRLYRARKCHDHENMRLEEACVKCFKVFCRKCERKDPCSLKSSKLPNLLQHVFLRSKHKTENIDQVAQRLRDNYSAPLRNLAEQITSRCKLEKTAFSTLDDNSTKIEELIQSIDDITEKQIQGIRESAEKEKKVLKNTQRHNETLIYGYVSEIQRQRENLSSCRLLTDEHIKLSHDVDVISGYADKKLAVDELSKQNTGNQCPMLSSAYLIKKGEHRLCEIEAKVSTHPTGMIAKASFDTKKAMGVLWTHDKDLVVLYDDDDDEMSDEDAVSHDMFSYFDLGNRDERANRDSIASVNSTQTDSSSQTTTSYPIESVDVYLKRKNLQGVSLHDYKSVVAYKGSTMLGLTDTENGTTITKLSHRAIGLGKETIPNEYRIEEITMWTGRIMLMTTDHKLVVLDNDWEVSTIFGREVLAEIEIPGGMLGMEDGCLLVSDCRREGSLHMYELIGEQLEKKWTCFGLVEPTKICTDRYGNIYTASASQSVIYVISPSGEKQLELTAPELKDTKLSDMAINDDMLVVVIYTEGIKLFKLRYQLTEEDMTTPQQLKRTMSRRASGLRTTASKKWDSVYKKVAGKPAAKVKFEY